MNRLERTLAVLLTVSVALNLGNAVFDKWVVSTVVRAADRPSFDAAPCALPVKR